LTSYTRAALVKFIKLVPDLDAIQFRMHDESGLKHGEQEGFWSDVFKVVKQTSPNLRLDLRAKGLPVTVIQSAVDVGINFRIATKYWMEQMGMPYHSTHISRENQFDRRHSYADMLFYPQQYKMHWRLWNGGTTRILLWGDPEYARRFAESTHLYDGDGFEVNEPLATKMHGQPHNAKPFELLKPQHRYYDWEFERYWHFFQVFGRIGYNPETPPDVWQKEFEGRFGKQAAPYLEAALHQASWILPRIVASCAPYFSGFPTTRGWVEKQRHGDLPGYARIEGSDIQQFASFDEEAQLLIEGGETAKMLPSTNSQWFEKTSADIKKLIAEAEKVIGNKRNKEFNSTVTDLKILSGLAQYHARRIPAAVSYRLFERTQDASAFDQAIAYEREAIEAWRQIVAAAGDVYVDDLMLGPRAPLDKKTRTDKRLLISDLCGHWKDELARLENGLSSLEQTRSDLKAEGTPVEGNWKPAPPYRPSSNLSYDNLFQINHLTITSAPVGKPLAIKIKVSAPAGVKWVRLLYRSVNQTQNYQMLPMYPTGEKDSYEAVVPAEKINSKWDFMYLIEVMDHNGNGRIYPDLNKETPYRIVKLIR
jgi:hypothetical protein